MGVTLIANLLIYDTLQPNLGEGLLVARQLPTWAILYSLLFWWLIWSVTESTYYNGYLFPRIEAFTGRRENHQQDEDQTDIPGQLDDGHPHAHALSFKLSLERAEHLHRIHPGLHRAYTRRTSVARRRIAKPFLNRSAV